MWVTCHTKYDARENRRVPYGVKAAVNEHGNLSMTVMGDGDVSFFATHAELCDLLDRLRVAINAAEVLRASEVKP